MAPPTIRLWLAVLCGYLALGETLQSLPTFIVYRFHASTALAGVAVGIAFAATACTRPFAGRSADNGRARPVVALGGLLTALGGVGHWWAPDVPVILLSRLVMGAGEGALFSAALPWVLANASRPARVTGWFGLSMWGGLALGPVLAATLQEYTGVQTVWTTVIALGVASAVLVCTTRRKGETSTDARPARLIPAGATRPGFVFGLAAYGYGTISTLIVLYLSRPALGGHEFALAVFALGFLGTRLVGSPVVDRLGGRIVAAIALTVETVGLTLIATIPTAAGALAGTLVAGVGVSLMYPSTVWMTLQRSGPLRPGGSVGVMTSFWDLGIMTAGPLAGALVAPLGYRAAFAVAGALGVLGLAVTLRTSLARITPAAEGAPEHARPSTPQ